MYFWKCWQDSRYRFIAWTVLAAVLVAAFAVPAVCRFDPAAHRCLIIQTSDPSVQAAIWHDLQITLRPITCLGTLAALAFGSAFLADEFGTGTIEFLFTRPRRHRYLVWASWLLGMFESIAAVGISLFAGMALAIYSTHAVVIWRPLLLIPLITPLLMLSFGLTYFLSVLVKSGRTGYSLGVGFTVLYFGVASLTNTYLPEKLQLWTRWWWFHNLPTLARTTSPLPDGTVLAILGWAALALLFPFAVQKIMQRRDT